MFDKMLDDIEALADVQERTHVNCTNAIRQAVRNLRRLTAADGEGTPSEAALRQTIALQKVLIDQQAARIEQQRQEIDHLKRNPFGVRQ